MVKRLLSNAHVLLRLELILEFESHVGRTFDFCLQKKNKGVNCRERPGACVLIGVLRCESKRGRKGSSLLAIEMKARMYRSGEGGRKSLLNDPGSSYD